ncbi:hypothetical protein FQR65_LT03868 [Abscondita terminalis]|nr:hypothetical protein FQR65_LT03868 [Abscondita terminalis]
MLKQVILVLEVVLVLQVWAENNSIFDPIVNTPKGKIKGVIIKSLLQKDIFSFRGIRYGKAPVGDLRFQPPVAVDNWNYLYNATEDGAACPQPAPLSKSEDCLFLNVYTTKLPTRNDTVKRPVIVCIHPGAFYTNSGGSNIAGPQYLLDQDIVLVTMNYRLGSLGFISTGDKLAPGNNGLKDQVLALKWVQENILFFGGDPNLVTIAGYDAGGISVTAHLLSPMSKGLFHRAIAMSGSIFSQRPIENHQFNLAQKQARLVNCSDDSSENIMRCLKTKSAEELGNSLSGFYEFRYDPMFIWTPVVELDFGQERFLTEDPIKSVLKGNFAKVPFMSGVTTEELSYYATHLLSNPQWSHEINEDFETIFPVAFNYERDTNKSRHITRELKKYFFGKVSIDNTTKQGLEELYADGLIGFGVNRGVKLLAKFNTESTYYYRFSYKGRYSHVYFSNSGVVHLDDLMYLFWISPFFPKFTVDVPEYAIVKKLTSLIANFARTGKPIPSPSVELDSVEWIPFTPENNKYLDIGSTLEMRENLYTESVFGPDLKFSLLPRPENNFIWVYGYADFEFYKAFSGEDYKRELSLVFKFSVHKHLSAFFSGFATDLLIMRKLLGLVTVFYMILQTLEEEQSNLEPIVTTPKGKIKGAVIKSLLEKDIFSFRGIRYAKAPIGKLRFQPPVVVDNWENIFDATNDGPACPQRTTSPTSEDCLRLNVYTTRLPSENFNPKRPVIFYIHAGGFYSGTGASYLEGPQYLLDRDIVLVTINYRLGSLGFISTGDKLAPGNNGLKDQVLALKWVQENIASFGGDPNLVTIVGYSAGGVSVAAHLISPMSAGLFHRAIAMSDTIFAQWPIEHHQFYLAQKQARLLGCPDDTSENIINCLRTKSAEELGNLCLDLKNDPVLIWMPVIERDYGQEQFLSEHPITSAIKGNFTKVPFMTGITTLEFSYFATDLLRNPQWVREINEDFERVAPIAFMYERNTNKSSYVSSELRKHFIGDGPIDNSTSEGLKNLYADGAVAFGVNRGIKLIATQNTECNHYYYRFSYQGRFSHVYFPNTTIPEGVVHHDDLIYIFWISKLFPKFNTTDPEYSMVKKLTTLIENFAKTGKPIVSPSKDLDNIDWVPFTTQNNQYMDIGETLQMHENLYKDRYSVWERLFPLNAYES